MQSSPRGSSNSRTTSGDPLRRAQHCLESAGKRARRGGRSDATEILALLRQATTHIEEAVSGHTGARNTAQGAE